MRARICLLLLVVSLTTLPGFAQAPALTFGYRGPGDVAAIAIGAGGLLPLPATLAGESALVQFYITNAGASAVTLDSVSSSNAVVGVFPISLTVQAAQTGVLSILFQPKSTGVVTSTMSFRVGGSYNYSFTLTGTGLAPEFAFSYVLLPDGNQTSLSDGGAIAFPAAPTGQSLTATVLISNRGNGAGAVNSVSISGDSFRLSGLPLLPTNVSAGSTLQFNVVFTPAQNQTYQGGLQISVSGSTRSFQLSGAGTSATFTYAVVRDGVSLPLAMNGSIDFGRTPVSTPLSLSFVVRNTGNAAGTVGSVTVVGTGFAAANLVPLPTALATGASLTFGLVFTPTTPSDLSGRLIIDGITFNLVGTGLGSQFALTFSVGGTPIALPNNGTANFPNVVAGSSILATIGIQNTGNIAATINNVSLSGRYFMVTTPPMPAEIQAGASVALSLTFSPNALGVLTATLGIDAFSITLRGIGAAPPDLPAYSFTGVGTTALPSEQPSVGLALSEPYDIDIAGTLRLSFTPESFAADPAIQFASGGTSVSFRIPAKTTTAVFSTGASSVQFQSGTVAGTIAITPEFYTGEVPITPQSPLAKTVQIAAAAPVLRGVQIGTRTANSFEVLISGYCTARSLTQINLQFTAAAGANLQTGSLALNADSAFNAWYQSASSQAAGSQFTASITILVNGSISAIQSLSVTASNAKGTSNASNTVALQ